MANFTTYIKLPQGKNGSIYSCFRWALKDLFLFPRSASREENGLLYNSLWLVKCQFILGLPGHVKYPANDTLRVRSVEEDTLISDQGMMILFDQVSSLMFLLAGFWINIINAASPSSTSLRACCWRTDQMIAGYIGQLAR